MNARVIQSVRVHTHDRLLYCEEQAMMYSRVSIKVSSPSCDFWCLGCGVGTLYGPSYSDDTNLGEGLYEGNL